MKALVNLRRPLLFTQSNGAFGKHFSPCLFWWLIKGQTFAKESILVLDNGFSICKGLKGFLATGVQLWSVCVKLPVVYCCPHFCLNVISESNIFFLFWSASFTLSFKLSWSICSQIMSRKMARKQISQVQPLRGGNFIAFSLSQPIWKNDSTMPCIFYGSESVSSLE